jgi:hypothetical protein
MADTITNIIGKNVKLKDNGDGTNSLSVSIADTEINVAVNVDDIITAKQSVHDDFNCNANVQLNNNDVSTTNPIPVTSQSATASSSHARPNDTTAYTALDAVGTSPATNMLFENASAIAGAKIIINRVELMINVASVPSGMSGFKLHLYNAEPTAIADNSAFNLIAGDRTKYLGWIDIDLPTKLGDTLYVDMKGVNCQVKLASASTSLYGMLQTIGAYTPTAQAVKTVTLHTLGV